MPNNEEFYYTSEKKSTSFYPPFIGITYPDKNYSIKRQKSDTYVFEYILEGTGTLIHGNETFHPKAGDAYLLHTGYFHQYSSDFERPWKKLWMNVCGSLVTHLINDYGLSNKVLFQGFNNPKIFEEIFEAGKNKKDKETISLLLHKLIISLSDFVYNDKTAEKADLIKEYIDKNIGKKLLISEIEKEFFLSKSRIINIFKEKYSVTPYEYCLNEKITFAKLLLENTSLNINEISEKCGFSDSHYFSNLFYKKVGTYPKFYRKNV